MKVATTILLIYLLVSEAALASITRKHKKINIENWTFKASITAYGFYLINAKIIKLPQNFN